MTEPGFQPKSIWLKVHILFTSWFPFNRLIFENRRIHGPGRGLGKAGTLVQIKHGKFVPVLGYNKIPNWPWLLGLLHRAILYGASFSQRDDGLEESSVRWGHSHQINQQIHYIKSHWMDAKLTSKHENETKQPRESHHLPVIVILLIIPH